VDLWIGVLFAMLRKEAFRARKELGQVASLAGYVARIMEFA
tara:strand:+ start:402 stop:524 length:123 start_codon:yes stop_codon:yes gene_type:complete